MPATQINITLGTAGHIDHGKTALVKLLTGCETDRLKEEKERGMSIELGFAPCTLGDLEVGIVDVPGHEHFIKTMVAGATGIDGVMLVIAADDGVMPQTREHLDILTLLGVSRGIVVLTKIDRADAARQAEVRAQIEELTLGTFLDGAPVLGINNLTGDGFWELYAAIQKLVASITPRSAAGVFRMPLERGFSMKGHGTVVSGVPVTGSAKVGDEIVLLPHNETGRIHSIQVYGRESSEARSGQCAAVNVRHWEWSEIQRGSVVATPGYFEPRMWYLCRLNLLEREGRFLKNAAEVKFHTGTSEVPATVYLLGVFDAGGSRRVGMAPSSEPEKTTGHTGPPPNERNTGGHIGPPLQRDAVARAGEEWLIQIRTNEPIVAGPNDGFILRLASPPETIGGGRIVEAIDGKIKRTREDAVADAKRLAEAVRSEETFVEFAVEKAPRAAADEKELVVRTKLLPPRVAEHVAKLAREGKISEIARELWMHQDTLAALGAGILAALAEFHRASPESPGMTPIELGAKLRIEKAALAATIKSLASAGSIADRNGRLALSTHQSAFSDADRKLLDALEKLFRECPFNPPAADEAYVAQPPSAGAVSSLKPQEEGANTQARAPVPHKQETQPGAAVPHKLHKQQKQVERALKLLVEHGTLVRVAPDLLFHRDAVARAREILVETIRKEGSLESVRFKYLLGTTRKYAIPLLDYFDSVGLTVNRNHTRHLKT